MIDAAELMAMMTAHGIQIGHVPGGRPKITALDMAGAMGIAHVETRYQMLALAKYCLDDPAKHQAWSFWFQDRLAHYREQRAEWKRGQIDVLCSYTLEEATSANVCTRCDGVGSVLPGELRRECGRCRGTGKAYPGDSAMARLLGVDRRCLEKVWQPRIAECRRELQRWEYVALLGLATGLGWRH